MPDHDLDAWRAPRGAVFDGPRWGTLNGQPVGPVLPEPVPCEGCGGPVWWTEDATATQQGTGAEVSVRGVWERDLAEVNLGPLGLGAVLGASRWAWALQPHRCPLQVKARRRLGLLTGEPLDEPDDEAAGHAQG